MLVQCLKMYTPEFGLRPFKPLNASSVELRHGKRNFVRNVLIQDTHEYDRQRGEREIVEQNVGIVE
jgi:hypothetical protein